MGSRHCLTYCLARAVCRCRAPISLPCWIQMSLIDSPDRPVRSLRLQKGRAGQVGADGVWMECGWMVTALQVLLGGAYTAYTTIHDHAPVLGLWRPGRLAPSQEDQHGR